MSEPRTYERGPEEAFPNSCVIPEEHGEDPSPGDTWHDSSGDEWTLSVILLSGKELWHVTTPDDIYRGTTWFMLRNLANELESACNEQEIHNVVIELRRISKLDEAGYHERNQRVAELVDKLAEYEPNTRHCTSTGSPGLPRDPEDSSA